MTSHASSNSGEEKTSDVNSLSAPKEQQQEGPIVGLVKAAGDSDKEPTVLKMSDPSSQNNSEAPRNGPDGVMIGERLINKESLKKVVYNLVGFLEQASEVPELCGLDHHKHVAFRKNDIKIKHNGSECNFLSLYQECMESKLNECPDSFCEEFWTTALLQVTHGLHHLHKQGGVVGNLCPSSIVFSCNQEEVVIHNPLPTPSSGKEQDIRDLGNIFFYVLSKGKKDTDWEELQCTDVGIAKDLIKKMLEEEITTEDILKHPFFWSEQEKIDFISDAFDSIKHTQLYLDPALENEGSAIVNGDWIKHLKITSKEKTAIERAYPGKKKQIGKDILYNKAMGNKKKKRKNPKIDLLYFEKNEKKLQKISEKEWQTLMQSSDEEEMNDELKQAVQEKVCEWVSKQSEKTDNNTNEPEFKLLSGSVVLVKMSDEENDDKGYKKDSFFELLRFFRNCKAHYWESNQNIHRCFQSYPVGFWKYFSSRYPSLLSFLYNNRVKFKFFEGRTKSITRSTSLPKSN